MRFNQPYQRFDGFNLAEEKWEILLFVILPVFQQRFGNAGNSWITRIAPSINAFADLIHQWQGDKFPAIPMQINDDLR